MLTITVFVHKHSYHNDWWDNKRGSKLDFPLWLLAIMILIAATPVINVIAFIVGGVCYMVTYCERDVVFHCESKWYVGLRSFLNRPV